MGRLAIGISGALTMALISHHAFAEMPRYDVDAHCKVIASIGGAPSQSMLQACYQQEQGSYDAMKPSWDALPAAMRAHCDTIARVGGTGSFTMLQACVSQEQGAAKSNEQFQFKR